MNIIILNELHIGVNNNYNKLLKKDKVLRNTFENYSRFATANYSFYVYDNKKLIGFFYLIKNYDSIYYELDYGIIDEYRGMGISKLVIDFINKTDGMPKYVVAEVKKTNIYALKSLRNCEFVGTGKYGLNFIDEDEKFETLYFLLNKDVYEDFQNEYNDYCKKLVLEI